VVALLSQALVQAASLKAFVVCPRGILRETFFREYLFRGYSREYAEDLYAGRRLDEFPIVESSREVCDILLERF
jgi:hypothetical protein